eukprot:gene8727-6133_t
MEGDAQDVGHSSPTTRPSDVMPMECLCIPPRSRDDHSISYGSTGSTPPSGRGLHRSHSQPALVSPVVAERRRRERHETMGSMTRVMSSLLGSHIPTAPLVDLRFDGMIKPQSSTTTPWRSLEASLTRMPSDGLFSPVLDHHSPLNHSGPVPFTVALFQLLLLAAPAAVTIGFTFCTSIIPLAFVGKLRGERDMAGASVGFFLLCIFIQYPMMGLSYAIDTLCSQEFGRRGSTPLLGLILQRGVVINSIMLFPLCIGIYFLEPLLVHFYGPDVTRVAEEFLFYSPLYLYALLTLVSFSKFLNNQQKAYIPTMALTAGVIVTPFVQYKLTLLGLRYTMLGMAITTWLQVLVMLVITLTHKETRNSFALGAWSFAEILRMDAIKMYMSYGLPSALFVAAEASALDLSILLGASYGESQGSAWSAILNTVFLFAALAGGISTSACANIGRCIGSYSPSSAKRFVILSIMVVVAIASIDSFFIVVFFEKLLGLFGNTPSTIRLASPVRWLLPALHISDAVQYTFQGIFSGLGLNHLGAVLLLGSVWGVGIPMAFLLGSYFHWGIFGVCLGLTIGFWIEAPLMVCVATCYLDYDALCVEQHLQQVGEEQQRANETMPFISVPLDDLTSIYSSNYHLLFDSSRKIEGKKTVLFAYCFDNLKRQFIKHLLCEPRFSWAMNNSSRDASAMARAASLEPRSFARAGSPGRRYWADSERIVSYGATSTKGTPEPHKKRSRSQPILVSRFVYTRRLKQRTVREVSLKLVQEAKQSYFHGRFTSSHGAVFMAPSRAQQLATYLPSEYPSSPTGGDPVARDRLRRQIKARQTGETASFEGMSPENSVALLQDPIFLNQRCHSADDWRRRQAANDSFNDTVRAEARPGEETPLVGGSPLNADLARSLTSLRLASPRPPGAPLFELRIDSLKIPNASFASAMKNTSAEATPVQEGPKETKHVTIGESTDLTDMQVEREDYRIPVGGALLNLLFLAAPAAITIGFTFCTSIIPLAFVGKLRGERDMTGASVGYFLTSSLILYPMIGLTFAMDTLCSHEFGRDSASVELGLILQRGVLINFIVLTPLCIGMYFFRAPLVMLYGVEVADVAMEFLRYAPLLIYPLAILVAFTKFLNNQLQPEIPMIALTVGVFLTPVFQYALTPLGVQFTMLGMALTTIVQNQKPFGGWRLRDALAWGDVKEYIQLALPSALFVAAEASSFDVTVLLSAHFGQAEGSVWSAIMNLLFLFAALSGGVSASACANIGRCIGANDPDSAKRYVVISIIVVAIIGIVDSIFIVGFFNQLLSLFGTSEETKALAAPIKILLPAFHIADSVQFTFQGIFSGLGQNHLGAMILLFSLWGVGLPLSFLLGTYLQYGIFGVCLGITIGLCIEAPVMVFVATWYLDYDNLCYLQLLKEEADDEEEEVEEEESEEDSYDEEYVNDILRRSGIVLSHPRVDDDPNELHRQLWKQLAPRNYRKKYDASKKLIRKQNSLRAHSGRDTTTDTMAPQKIIIVRHGERKDRVDPEFAESNLRPHDPPLTPAGISDAARLGEYLMHQLQIQPRDTVVITTPLLRAVQTAAGVVKGMCGGSTGSNEKVSEGAAPAYGIPIYVEESLVGCGWLPKEGRHRPPTPPDGRHPPGPPGRRKGPPRFGDPTQPAKGLDKLPQPILNDTAALRTTYSMDILLDSLSLAEAPPLTEFNEQLSPHKFEERCRRGIQAMLDHPKLDGKNIVFVGHGDTTHMCFEEVVGAEPEFGREMLTGFTLLVPVPGEKRKWMLQGSVMWFKVAHETTPLTDTRPKHFASALSTYCLPDSLLLLLQFLSDCIKQQCFPCTFFYLFPTLEPTLWGS